MSTSRYVLQICQNYERPFHNIAKQYNQLLEHNFTVITVFLTGEKSQDIIDYIASDQVIFLDNTSKDLRGLKLKAIKQVKQLCEQFQFEFVIAHRYKPLYIASQLKHLPIIGVSHVFNDFARFSRRLYFYFKRKNIFFLAVSNAVRDDIRLALPNFPKQRIQTLYNYLEIDQVTQHQLSQVDGRQALKLPENAYLFANVARLNSWKGQKTLINAFSMIADQCPEALLVLIGTGQQKTQLEHLVATLKLEERILFLGNVPDAVNYFKAFDAFVLPSNKEPFGMVLLEAILADLPIIATNAGGAKEIILNQHWLFDVDDSSKLAEIMLACYQQTTNQEQLCQENRLHLDAHFTDKAVRMAFYKLPFPFINDLHLNDKA